MSLISECTSIFNNVRNVPLAWTDHGYQSTVAAAKYCADVKQEHTNVIGGQILFITKTSCSNGIAGWTKSKPHFNIITDSRYATFNCAVATTGRKCIACHFFHGKTKQAKRVVSKKEDNDDC
jgi:hypothetical protein